MATITLTIPDAALPRVVDALCAYGGQAADSPVAKGAFAKGVVGSWVKSIVRAHEAQQAAEAARLAAEVKADAEVTIS